MELIKKEVQLMRLANDLLWPFYKNIKAWSASKLTQFIKEIEYGEVPAYVLKMAAQRGKTFHDIIQNYFQTGFYPAYIDFTNDFEKLSKIEKRIYETIHFLKKNKNIDPSLFISNEELHYTFYSGELIATYTDIKLNDCVIELKTSNIMSKNNPLILITFEIQLLIQHLCTQKDVYLLWSTGEGIIFSKFRPTKKIIKVLDLLINIAHEVQDYTNDKKKLIINQILNTYTPKKLNITTIIPTIEYK